MNVTAVEEFNHAGRTIKFESRSDIVRLAGPGCIGIELGTGNTNFCTSVLEQCEIEFLYTVDEYTNQLNSMRHAFSTISMYRTKATLILASFTEAAEYFNDESFDWIYIEGSAYDWRQENQTFNKWWPKLKPNGIFAGNKYDMSSYPLLIKKLHTFALEESRDINIVDFSGADQRPVENWFIIK
jgi:hypothetical protein